MQNSSGIKVHIMQIFDHLPEPLTGVLRQPATDAPLSQLLEACDDLLKKFADTSSESVMELAYFRDIAARAADDPEAPPGYASCMAAVLELVMRKIRDHPGTCAAQAWKLMTYRREDVESWIWFAKKSFRNDVLARYRAQQAYERFTASQEPCGQAMAAAELKDVIDDYLSQVHDHYMRTHDGNPKDPCDDIGFTCLILIVFFNLFFLGWLFDNFVFPMKEAGTLFTIIVMIVVIALSWAIAGGIGRIFTAMVGPERLDKIDALLRRGHIAIQRIPRRFRLCFSRFGRLFFCRKESREDIAARLPGLLKNCDAPTGKSAGPGLTQLLLWARDVAVAAVGDPRAPMKYVRYVMDNLQSIVNTMAKRPEFLDEPIWTPPKYDSRDAPESLVKAVQESRKYVSKTVLEQYADSFTARWGDRMTRYHAKQAYEYFLFSQDPRQQVLATDQLDDVSYILRKRCIDRGYIIVIREPWDDPEKEPPYRHSRTLFRWRYK